MPPLFVHTGPPRIVTPPQPVVTAVADGVQHNTKFNCTAVGDPAPHTLWMHSMQSISQNGRFQVTTTEDGGYRTSSTLAINDLTATDSGNIQCVADNPHGIASANTTLSILSECFLVTRIA